MASETVSPKRRRRFSWIRLLGVVIAVLIVVQMISEYSTYNQLKNEVEHYQQQLALAEAEYQEVVEKQELLNNDSYVERLARDNLGMVKEGEVRVTLVKSSTDSDSDNNSMQE